MIKKCLECFVGSEEGMEPRRIQDEDISWADCDQMDGSTETGLGKVQSVPHVPPCASVPSLKEKSIEMTWQSLRFFQL